MQGPITIQNLFNVFEVQLQKLHWDVAKIVTDSFYDFKKEPSSRTVEYSIEFPTVNEDLSFSFKFYFRRWGNNNLNLMNLEIVMFLFKEEEDFVPERMKTQILDMTSYIESILICELIKNIVLEYLGDIRDGLSSKTEHYEKVINYAVTTTNISNQTKPKGE